jgi:diguanylate cyclase (GGDEF)-like protein
MTDEFIPDMLAPPKELTETLIHVLFVDDDPAILSAMHRAFKQKPFKSFLAESGEAALEVLREQRIDIIVSDLKMPGMDGVELMKIVHERYPECLRIILSGHADVFDMATLVNEAEIDGFLEKPWKDEELKNKIFHLVRKRQYEMHSKREVQEQIKKLQALAGMDDITRTVRPSKLEEYLLSQIEINRRYGVSFSIISIEMDNFDWIEQQVDPNALCEVINEFANQIMNRMRIIDMLGRNTDAWFTLVCPYTSCAQAMIFAEDLRQLVETHDFHLPFKITASFGIAEFVDLALSRDELIERAQFSLSEAKKSGGNTVIAHNW